MSTPEITAGVRWTDAPEGLRFQLDGAFAESTEGAASARWLDEWRDDSPAAGAATSIDVLVPWSDWLAAGHPPDAGAPPELVDVFQRRHGALAQLLGIASQRVGIESIGHVGAAELSFIFVADSVRVAPSPGGFPRDAAGAIYPLSPCAHAVYDRIRDWNARGTTTRPQQIRFLAELRELLDRAASVLEGTAVPFAFELDAHLEPFHARRASEVALAWKPDARGAVFDLELAEVSEDGTRHPIDLKGLDPDNPLVAISTHEHILLDPDLHAVARVARGQRNRLRKHVERHLDSPATLVPEGVSLDHVDLSSYSPRVVGFAPIVRAERYCDITSSGVSWYSSADERPGAAPFLRLLVAQPAGGGIEALVFNTSDEAEDALARLDQSLARGDGGALDLGGKRVEPTLALKNRLGADLATYRERLARAASPDAADPEPDDRAARVAAVIAESTEPVRELPAVATEHPVPWAALASLLAPGYQLKAHQRDAIDWLWSHYHRGAAGVLLADDMGLGKTLQVAAFLALLRQVEAGGPRLPTLIVCPVILLDNWRDELRKFFPPEVFASLLTLYDDGLRRMKRGGHLDLAAIARFDYVLTNYETLQAYQQSLLAQDWHVVVLDEAQAIKNPDTYRARAARGLKRRFAIAATGTPVENRLADLWSVYDFLSPGVPFTTLKDFQRDFETDVQAGVAKVRGALAYPGARSSLLRRSKSEVLDLPPKTLVVHHVEMTAPQVDLERHVTAPREGTRNILRILQDLQKLYQHPRLLLPEGERGVRASVATLVEQSPKLALCLRILRDAAAAGEKALVFTLWTDMQDMLVEVFKQELGVGVVRVINGDPAHRRMAKKYIEEFTATPGFAVMVLSPIAAGTGLTITAANHVIHYGRWWNPAKEDQATDRAYRIGQTRPVQVHYPLLHHPGRRSEGFDVKLHELVERKRSTARDFLAPQAQEAVTLQDLDAIGAT